MKVGTLIRALSLLQLLPSATVLSLTGGIDRTMKAGLALYLFASIPTVAATQKTEVVGCTEMMCFASSVCKGYTQIAMSQIMAEDQLTTDCKAILKIRAYSTKMYRVVLESRDPTVTEITLTRVGSPLFSCKAGSNKAQYKNTAIDLINDPVTPIKCEFIATEANSDIMDDSTKVLKMEINGGTQWKTDEKLIQGVLKPHENCNPAVAEFDSGLNSGEYAVDHFIVGLTDLSCRTPYQLETRLRVTDSVTHMIRLEDQFVKTTSINCVVERDENGDVTVTKWVIDRGASRSAITNDKHFSYRCASKSCTLCDYLPKAAENTLEIVDGSGGCKELKCTKNRLKVGDTLGDKAICTKSNDKAVWSLNETLIEASTSVVCFEKLKCDTTSICDEKKSENYCVLDKNEVPTCSFGSHLTYQSERITVDCDGNTGKWMYKDGKRPATELPAGESLSCLSDSEISRKEDPAAASMTTIAYAAGGVVAFIVIAALVGFGIYWYMKKRAAKNGKTGKSVETPNPKSQSKSVNSKESKKEGEAAPASALPPEYTSRAPTIVMPAYIKTIKYSDISEGESHAEAEDKKRKEKKQKKKELKRLLREKEAVEEELRKVEKKERKMARKEKKNKVYEPEDGVDDKDDGFGPTQRDPEAPEVTQPTQVTGGTGQAAVAATQDTTTTKQK